MKTLQDRFIVNLRRRSFFAQKKEFMFFNKKNIPSIIKLYFNNINMGLFKEFFRVHFDVKKGNNLIVNVNRE